MVVAELLSLRCRTEVALSPWRPPRLLAIRPLLQQHGYLLHLNQQENAPLWSAETVSYDVTLMFKALPRWREGVTG